MKKILWSIALAPFLLLHSRPAKADVDVRLGFGGYGRGYYGRPYYGHGYWRGGYYYAAPVVVGAYAAPYYYPYYAAPAPVYAPVQPTYAPQPDQQQAQPQPQPQPQQQAAPEDGTAIPLSGDYATDLASLNGRLSKQRNLLNRQKAKGGITEARYNQFMNELEAIEHDEHSRAYNNGGRLSDQDLADLIGRTDQVRQEIDDALVE